MHSTVDEQDASDNEKEKHGPVLRDEISHSKSIVEMHETKSAFNNNQSNVLSSKSDTIHMSHPTSSKSFSCNKCNKKFDVPSKLRFHRLKKHNKRVDEENGIKNFTEGDKVPSKEKKIRLDFDTEESFPKDKERHQKKIDKMKDQEESPKISEGSVGITCNDKPKLTDEGNMEEHTSAKPSTELQEEHKENLNDKFNEHNTNMPKDMNKSSILQVDPLKVSEDPNETLAKKADEGEGLILNYTENVKIKIEGEELPKSSSNGQYVHHEDQENYEKKIKKEAIPLQLDEKQQDLGGKDAFDSTYQRNLLTENECNDKEEFRMPDNFDLPDEFLFSIKHNSREIVSNADTQTNTDRSSGVTSDDASLHSSPKYKSNTERKEVQ